MCDSCAALVLDLACQPALVVASQIADNLLKLIAEGVPRDNEDDIRHFAVNTYVELLQKPVLSDILMQVSHYI